MPPLLSLTLTRWLCRLLPLLFALVVLAGCGGKRSAKAYDDGGYYAEEAVMLEAASAPAGRSMSRAAPAAPPAPMMEMASDQAGASPPPPPPDPSTGEPAPPDAPDRMVFYDGWARLRVLDVETGVDAVRTVAEGAGGFVERVSARSVTVRVPVASFEESFDAVLALGEVMDKSISARDVTAAYTAVDLRLQTAEATRARLQELLARAEEEQEKLQLIRQIQRLTEEIDRLQAQVRTLADLAALSRITAELVPREALAHQGPEDDVAELAWIRSLSPFRNDLAAESKDLDLPTPEGMVRLDERGPFVAESPEGARVWTHRLHNDPEGDAAFWIAAIEERLAGDFASAEVSTVGGWQVLTLVDRGEDPWTWQLAVKVDGRWVEFLQAYLPDPEAAERYQPAVDAVLEGGAA